ncbi:hypothetical protein HYQ44_002024 [Verticillium longisporum]|nr:hypothetical protein HYQ44_002024 [Verticillium longisporum]
MCLTKDVRTRSHPSNMTQLGTLARIGGSAKTVSVLIPSRQKTFPALPKTIAHATGRTRISFGESSCGTSSTLICSAWRRDVISAISYAPPPFIFKTTTYRLRYK